MSRSTFGRLAGGIGAIPPDWSQLVGLAYGITSYPILILFVYQADGLAASLVAGVVGIPAAMEVFLLSWLSVEVASFELARIELWQREWFAKPQPSIRRRLGLAVIWASCLIGPVVVVGSLAVAVDYGRSHHGFPGTCVAAVVSVPLAVLPAGAVGPASVAIGIGLLTVIEGAPLSVAVRAALGSAPNDEPDEGAESGDSRADGARVGPGAGTIG